MSSHGDQPARPFAASDLTDATRTAADWLHTCALARVLASFDIDPGRGVGDVGHWGPGIAEALDSRHGRERQVERATTFTESQVLALLEAAEPLGILSRAATTRAAYDLVVVLGGTVDAHRRRSELAARLLGSVRAARVLGLGSERLLEDDERLVAHASARTESDDLANAMASAGLGSDVFTGVTRDGTTRASTASALEDLLATTTPGAVLLVSSAIYVPYQFFAAAPIVLASAAATLEVVGTETLATRSDDLRAQAIGQEIGAAVSAAMRLLTLRPTRQAT